MTKDEKIAALKEYLSSAGVSIDIADPRVSEDVINLAYERLCLAKKSAARKPLASSVRKS